MKVVSVLLGLFFFAAFAYAQNADPQFEEYRVHVIPTPKNVSLKLEKGTEFYRFRTRIRNGWKEEPNFASHYVIVQWGCGTECQSGVLLDKNTGRIYGFPVTSRGALYEKGSNLLVVDPYTNGDTMAFIPTRFYLWDGNDFVLLFTKENE